MKIDWAHLSEADHKTFSLTNAFLDKRLADREIIDWALTLRAYDLGKRLAVIHTLDRHEDIPEPWQSAWRLIEESWDRPTQNLSSSVRVYDVHRRIRGGETSGGVIAALVDLVKPGVSVEPFSEAHLKYYPVVKRPKSVSQLFSVSVTSGKVKSLGEVGLDTIDDVRFLTAIADSLHAAVIHGVNLGRRLGGHQTGNLWRIGGLYRVYFVAEADRDEDQEEPDEYHRGIAPAVKLLHGVVQRIANLSIEEARRIVRGWGERRDPLHLRLWAALAFNRDVVDGNEVARFLIDARSDEFWDANEYPEVAELRARRFGDLDPGSQMKILARLRRKPPRSQWPRNADNSKVQEARHYWVVREYQRIAVAGHALPPSFQAALEEGKAVFEDLAEMRSVQEGFMGTHKARSIPAEPDERFDALRGLERLEALEDALSSGRGGWQKGPAERASDWIRAAGNVDEVFADLRAANVSGASVDYPKVWEVFGWAYTSVVATPDATEEVVKRDGRVNRDSLSGLVLTLSDRTITEAIDAITNLMSTIEIGFVDAALGRQAWFKVWPFAVSATNAQVEDPFSTELDVVVGGGAKPTPQRSGYLEHASWPFSWRVFTGLPQSGKRPSSLRRQ